MRTKFKSTCPPVLYDEKAHREFVTGFRARKVARRERAIYEAAQNEKANRIEERRERRQFLQESRDQFLQAMKNDDDSDDDSNEQKVTKQEYDDQTEGQGTVTTLVTPLDVKPSNVPFSEVITAAKEKKEEPATSSRRAGKDTDKKDSNLVRKVASVIGKQKKTKGSSSKRHVSYTHKFHQKKSNRNGNKKTTHGERRKRA